MFDPRSRKSSEVLDLRPRCPGDTPDISRLVDQYEHQRFYQYRGRGESKEVSCKSRFRLNLVPAFPVYQVLSSIDRPCFGQLLAGWALIADD